MIPGLGESLPDQSLITGLLDGSGFRLDSAERIPGPHLLHPDRPQILHPQACLHVVGEVGLADFHRRQVQHHPGPGRAQFGV